MSLTHLSNLVNCLEHQKLDVKSALEDVIKQESFHIACLTTLSGTHYHYLPATDEAAAPNVVMLHALGGNSFNWLNLAPFLSEANLYIVDLPSHGQSADLPASKSYRAAYTEWLQQFMEEAKIEQPHLVGLSTGGRIAAAYALAGKRLASLTLFAPALTPETGLLYHSVYSLLQSRERKLLKNVGYKVLLRLTVRRDTLSKYAINMAHHELIRDQSRRDYLGLRQTMSWLLEPFDYAAAEWEALAAKIPCRAIFGDKDIYCSAERHYYLVDSGVTCVHALDAGHLVSFDNPQVCASAILRAINKKSD